VQSKATPLQKLTSIFQEYFPWENIVDLLGKGNDAEVICPAGEASH